MYWLEYCSVREILINRKILSVEVYTILSLAKSNLIRRNVFLPQIDFGLLAFDTNTDSLEGSGPKRERAEVDLKTDELQPETQVALRSQLSLEDFLVPNNAGILERKAFFVASPQSSAIIFGYLIFGSSLLNTGNPNPRHLVYKTFDFPAQNYSGYASPQGDVSYPGQTAYEFASTQSVQYGTFPQIIGWHYINTFIKPSEFLRGEFASQPYTENLAKGYDFSAAKPTAIYSIKPIAQPIHASPAYDMPKHAIEALNDSFWQTTSSFIGIYKPTEARLGEEKVQTRKTLENVIAKTGMPRYATQSQIFQPPQSIPMQLSPPKYGRGVDFIISSYFAGKLSLPYETTPKTQIPVLGISLGTILTSLNIFRASDSPKTQNSLHNYQKPDILKTVVMASQAQQYILEESQNGNQEHNNSNQQNGHRANDKAQQAAKSKTQNSNVIYLNNYRNPRRRNNSDWQPRYIKGKYKAILRDSNRKLAEVAKRSSGYLLTLTTFNQFYTNAKSLYSKLKSGAEQTSDNYRAGQTAISESLSARINSDNQPNPNVNLESLQNGAKYLEEKSGGKVSYIIIDSVTGEIIAERNADEMVSNGSMSKIFILRQILELSQQGKINLESELKLRNSQRPRNHTLTERPITIREGLREMVSDENGNSNWIATALLEQIGIKRANKMVGQQGYNKTVFVDYYRQKDLYRGNKTSARDTASEMFRLRNGIGIDGYHHKVALESLDGRHITYPISKNLEGLNKEKIIVKHGQTERDISLACGIEGVNNNGEEFKRILVYIDSDINKRLVKKDFRTATPSGPGIMNLFIDKLRQACTIAKEYVSYKRAA